MRSFALFFGLVSLCSFSTAEITYTVKPTPEGTLGVKMTIPVQSGVTKLQIPNWAPGSYAYADNWRRVSKVALTGDIASLQAKENNFTWVVSASKSGTVNLSYEVPVGLADGVGHYSGPSTYLYVVGRIGEKCKVKFDFSALGAAAKETRVAVGLDPIKEHVEYIADDYDVLADNPVTYGKFVMDTYKVNGKTHYIAYRGAAATDIDRMYTKKACEYVTRMQGDFFSGYPYNRYVWHFQVNDRSDGAGGLEHLSSTQISLASGVGPRAVSVISHEFFHLWNVKRIRSRVLGPFDYTTLPQTGALWWLEGVTDYYANTLLPRYGWWKTPDLYADLMRNLRAVRSRPARFEVSPYESSYRVRDAANGRGNSQGYQVSYYDTGWLAGFCLDVELLHETNGKHSLDDIELALWEQSKKQALGFEEGEIRRLCTEFGGLSLGYFYDRIIMKAGEMPVEAQLAKLGLEIVDQTLTEPQLGGRMVVEVAKNSLRVAEVSATDGPLKVNDLVSEINGIPTVGATNKNLSNAYAKALKSLQIGKEITMKVTRGDKVETIKIKVSGTPRVSKVVAEKPDATPAQKKLRKIFESKHRRSRA